MVTLMVTVNKADVTVTVNKGDRLKSNEAIKL